MSRDISKKSEPSSGFGFLVFAESVEAAGFVEGSSDTDVVKVPSTHKVTAPAET